jgi:hypothetical protein
VRAGVPLFELYGSRTPWLLGWAAALLGLALAALPFAASAQGTYLSAPDGDPTNALVVAPGGNIGIGTTEPLGKLSISPNPAVGYHFTASDNPGGYQTAFNMTDTGLYIGHNTPYRNLILQTDRRDRLTITGDGNVGIGTTSPQAKLDVAGNVEVKRGQQFIARYSDVSRHRSASLSWSGLQLGNHDNNYIVGGRGVRGGSIIFVTDNTEDYSYGQHDGKEVMALTANGNVGIGTTDPQAKLDVNGKINCTVLELTSDRNQKQDFAAVDSRSVLERLIGLPSRPGPIPTTPTPATSARWRRIGRLPSPNSAQTTSTSPPATSPASPSPPFRR